MYKCAVIKIEQISLSCCCVHIFFLCIPRKDCFWNNCYQRIIITSDLAIIFLQENIFSCFLCPVNLLNDKVPLHEVLVKRSFTPNQNSLRFLVQKIIVVNFYKTIFTGLSNYNIKLIYAWPLM